MVTDLSEFSRGDRVVFFHGRSPHQGQVEEIQEDGRIVVLIKAGDSTVRILKDEDEIKSYSEVKGKHARIRFV